MTIATKPSKPAILSPNAAGGRVHIVSSKNLPRLDAKAKARLEAAARNPATRRRYPELPE